MTRPRPAAERFVAAMPADLGARVEPLYSPLMRIEAVSGATFPLDTEAAIFTSSNGVALGPDGAGRIAYCVGTATTALAARHGWAAQMAGQDTEALIKNLMKLPPDQPMVHIRGQHTRGGITARLGAAGHGIRDVIVYDQVLQPLSDTAKNAIVREPMTVVPLFSPRTAAHFATQAPCATSLRVVAMSNAVADAAQPHIAEAVAVRPDAQAMCDAIADVISSG